MLPYRLLFNIGSKAVGTFMQRRAKKANVNMTLLCEKWQQAMKELKEMAH